MATEVPDPHSLESWEDAFQYPIPVVRKLGQQLRSHVEENRQKLRNSVGVSYRDLLGTAERIVEMDEQMEQVEAILGKAGQKCNSGAVQRIFNNYSRFQTELYARDSEQNALASHLAILQSCPTIISRLLKGGNSSLLAAKILVFSRLTHKTLAQTPDPPPLLDASRQRLASLRRKLLRSIDRSLQSVDKETDDLVEDMCAFSLATSSTPTDVLRHFHHVRLEAIGWHFEQEDDGNAHVLAAMRLLIQTLQDSQQIFPKRLAAALAKLKEHPLLQQKDVRSVSQLSLDIHGRWIADELRNYTPWPRHDELQKAEADKQLKAWSKQALARFLAGLKSVLVKNREFRDVMRLRKDVLEAWPWSTRRLPGIEPSDVLEELRELFNGRLGAIIRDRAREVEQIPKAILQELDSPQTPQTSYLWDQDVIAMDYSNGATAFKQAVLDKYQGTNPSIAHIAALYDAWLGNITSTQALLKEMRDTHWDDELDDSDSDLEFDSLQIQLSQDDPRLLDQALATTLEAASTSLHSSLSNLITPLTAAPPNPNTAAFLLRVLRALSQRAPPDPKASPSAPLSTLATPLHHALATAVTTPALNAFSTSLHRMLTARTFPAVVLWEGNPPLPTQPSRPTILFLKTLTQAMSASGPDLWAAGALTALRTICLEWIAEELDPRASRAPALTSATEDAPSSPALCIENSRAGAVAPNGRLGGEGGGCPPGRGELERFAGSPSRGPGGGGGRGGLGSLGGLGGRGEGGAEGEERLSGEGPAGDSAGEKGSEEGQEVIPDQRPSDERRGVIEDQRPSDEGRGVIEDQRPSDEGREANRDAQAVNLDAQVQLLFDAAFLRYVMHGSPGPAAEATGLPLEAGQWERMARMAGEYWRRTGLLYGLLGGFEEGRI
ncbi:hypothetical protein EJ06DRAFT_584722 [Trichodelitschia bisporula]|uniref:Conserved oligomeric Golgi complex subunit 1 n=1 Tax=Trichodelitschia bisporula TaxID=703511 RepID=A0A6G1HMN4_9PEZI|nr:hypothetical protein EJ06DRAFT_584722 [Trichodelitschia bisporula]